MCVGMFMCVADFLFTGLGCGFVTEGSKAKKWRNVGQVNQTASNK